MNAKDMTLILRACDPDRRRPYIVAIAKNWWAEEEEVEPLDNDRL